MIEIRNLYKRYHNHHDSPWVLKDISLTIPSGVSVGLLGRNGAGKSTLLRLIGGMDSPDRGEIIRNSRVSWPIGLAGGFQGSMTGRQNVKFVARIHGAEEEIERVVREVEEFAEIVFGNETGELVAETTILREIIQKCKIRFMGVPEQARMVTVDTPVPL